MSTPTTKLGLSQVSIQEESTQYIIEDWLRTINGAATLQNDFKKIDNFASTIDASVQTKITNPSGGTVGQVLKKSANGEEWANEIGGEPATETPLMDGTGAVGSSTKYAREDHVHPSDTTKITNPANGQVGQVLKKTASGEEWANEIGGEPATETPQMDGAGAVGYSLKYAREDHVHPSDTTKITNPNGGSVGQFLKKTSDGTAWDDVPATVEPATSTPLMDGAGAVGSSLKYAREDHEHPSDTTKITNPSGGSVGDVLKKTASGVEWGQGAYGGMTQGYYYNGNFYSDSSHTQLITPNINTIYVDIGSPSKTLYYYSGTQYIAISNAGNIYTGTITGDGTTTSFAVTHGLNTRDAFVLVYDASTYDDVLVDIHRTTVNSYTFGFSVAPVSGQIYNVVISAGGGSGGGGGGYFVPIASTTVLGGVQGDGATVNIDSSGVLSYAGTVLYAQYDTTTMELTISTTPFNNNSNLSNSNSNTNTTTTVPMPIASTTNLGGVIPDGVTMQTTAEGVLSYVGTVITAVYNSSTGHLELTTPSAS